MAAWAASESSDHRRRLMYDLAIDTWGTSTSDGPDEISVRERTEERPVRSALAVAGSLEHQRHPMLVL